MMYILIHSHIYFVEFDIIITTHLPMNSGNVDRHPLGFKHTYKNKEISIKTKTTNATKQIQVFFRFISPYSQYDLLVED